MGFCAIFIVISLYFFMKPFFTVAFFYPGSHVQFILILKKTRGVKSIINAVLGSFHRSTTITCISITDFFSQSIKNGCSKSHYLLLFADTTNFDSRCFTELFYQVSFLKLINMEAPSIYNIVTYLSGESILSFVRYCILHTYSLPVTPLAYKVVTRVLHASMSLNSSWSVSQY